MPRKGKTPFKPERATKPGAYPVIFYMHFHVGDKELVSMIAPWVGRGIAVFAIDGVYRGERLDETKDIFSPDPRETAQNIRNQIMDILRGFDVIAQWDGLDPGRIGFMGISMGAITGTAAVTLDKRVNTVLLVDGAGDFNLIFDLSTYGDSEKIKTFMDENNITKEQLVGAFRIVDPLAFAPYLVDRPVFMINGEKDTILPVPAIKELYENLGTKDKSIKWFPSDHYLPFDKVLPECLKWFLKYL
jgi:cephalosporin-C deacetylase-like acetyl esterase